MRPLPDDAREQLLQRMQGGIRSPHSRDHADMLPILEPMRELIEAVFNTHEAEGRNDDPEIIDACVALVDALRQLVALEVDEMWCAVYESDERHSSPLPSPRVEREIVEAA